MTKRQPKKNNPRLCYVDFDDCIQRRSPFEDGSLWVDKHGKELLVACMRKLRGCKRRIKASGFH
jgi:hypothetical protein